MAKKKGCLGCEQAEKEGLVVQKLTDNPDVQFIMENSPEGMRIHLTDGLHHRVQRIFFCPFCGKEFE